MPRGRFACRVVKALQPAFLPQPVAKTRNDDRRGQGIGGARQRAVGRIHPRLGHPTMTECPASPPLYLWNPSFGGRTALCWPTY